MSVPIRFRAWDKRNNTWMHNFKEMGGFNLFGETIVLGGWLNGVSLQDFDKITVQQFIGLKDKTGKEIYDGDIVALDDGGHPSHPDNVNSIAVVERRASAWGYKPTTGCFAYISEINGELDVDEYATVIGNIFENPELIKENE